MEFLCLEFINSWWYTEHKPCYELLRDETWLRGFCGKWDLPELSPTAETVRALLEARGALHAALVELVEKKTLSAGSLAMLNRYLAAVEARNTLERCSGGFRLHLVLAGADVDRALFRIALSCSELVSEHALERLKICGNPNCGWIFYDESKNRTRKWCENTCASLIKVRKFRAKK